MTGFRVSRERLVGAGAASTPTCSRSARSWAAGCRPRRSAAGPTSWATSRPPGPVYQAGTLSGNPIAVAAGLAQLRHCTDDVYAARRQDRRSP